MYCGPASLVKNVSVPPYETLNSMGGFGSSDTAIASPSTNVPRRVVVLPSWYQNVVSAEGAAAHVTHRTNRQVSRVDEGQGLGQTEQRPQQR